MTISNEELRPIVEAALGPDCSFASINVFKAKISPAKVKAMLDQIDALTGALLMARDHVKHFGTAYQLDQVNAALENVGANDERY